MRQAQRAANRTGRDAGRGIVIAVAALSLMAGGAVSARCAPNGLTQIPIAKVFGDGVAAFSVARVAQGSQTTTDTAQYGIGNVCEVGLDYQAAPSDQKTFLGNVKYLFVHRPGRMPDMACGLTNLATGQKAVPYIVATTQPKATGFTLGSIRPTGGDAYYGLAGVSYNITPDFPASRRRDRRASYGTLGVIASLTKTITLNVAYAQPNTGSSDGGTNPHGYVFNLAYTFHLKGGSKGQDKPQNKNPTAGGVG
jgi:hypothetical protein